MMTDCVWHTGLHLGEHSFARLDEREGEIASCALKAPAQPYRALYLHIPFCVKRCMYCDFQTEAIDSSSDAIDTYIEKLCLELRRCSRNDLLGALDTVYLGGGTPSFIRLSRLSMLLYTLSVSMHLTPEVECTMEANPESLTERMVKDVWALGVNRLSIGVQSFDDAVLQTLGRAHNADSARKALSVARERFDNVSVDIMCGIPGQSAQSLEASVREAVRLGATHVSVYPLTIEEGTPFHRLVNAGDLGEPDNDVQADHMLRASSILQEAGFARYEVASYALPGCESRHNQAYWTGKPYLGLGKGAASMVQGDSWRLRVADGVVADALDAKQMLAEDLILGMRMARGIDALSYERAIDSFPHAGEVFARLESDGLILRAGNRWVPTERGWLCGNELYGALLALDD